MIKTIWYATCVLFPLSIGILTRVAAMDPSFPQKPQDVKSLLDLILQRTHDTAQTIQERIEHVSRRYQVAESGHDVAPVCRSDV